MTTNKLLSKYENACEGIVMEFTKKYFYNRFKETDHDIGEFNKYYEYYVSSADGHIDGIYEIDDMFFNIADIYTILKHKAKWDDITSWYYTSLERSEENKPMPNLLNWIKYPNNRKDFLK